MKRIVVTSAAAWEVCELAAPLAQRGYEVAFAPEVDAARVDDATLAALDGAWAVVAGMEPYSATLLAQLPELRVIARFGSGSDNVDAVAAEQAGVAVLTAPGANSEAVADAAVMLMLSCRRRLLELDAAVRSGRWRPDGLAADLSAATVLIVGLGAIGSAVARRLRGFDCVLRCVDPSPDPDRCRRLGVEVVDIDGGIADSDIVTLHAPLTGQTRGLIGRDELRLMRRDAVLINTARGPLVDEQALAEALRRGEIGGAGLDVYDWEPLAQGNPLLDAPRLVLTGHAAARTHGAMRRTMERVIGSLVEFDLTSSEIM